MGYSMVHAGGSMDDNEIERREDDDVLSAETAGIEQGRVSAYCVSWSMSFGRPPEVSIASPVS